MNYSGSKNYKVDHTHTQTHTRARPSGRQLNTIFFDVLDHSEDSDTNISIPFFFSPKHSFLRIWNKQRSSTRLPSEPSFLQHIHQRLGRNIVKKNTEGTALGSNSGTGLKVYALLLGGVKSNLLDRQNALLLQKSLWCLVVRSYLDRHTKFQCDTGLSFVLTADCCWSVSHHVVPSKTIFFLS